MTPNGADPKDPVEQIFTALARLRPRGRPVPLGGDDDAPLRGPHHHGRGAWSDPHPIPPWAGAMSDRISGPARLRMLDALIAAPEPLSVGALGEAIGVDQPRASRLVQQGVDRGLVRREADPADARRTRIALTDHGRALVGRFRGARHEAIATALSDFSAAERADFARLLTKFAGAWPR